MVLGRMPPGITATLMSIPLSDRLPRASLVAQCAIVLRSQHGSLAASVLLRTRQGSWGTLAVGRRQEYSILVGPPCYSGSCISAIRLFCRVVASSSEGGIRIILQRVRCVR